MNVSIDPAEFVPLIEETVETAIRRMQAENRTDNEGRLLWDKRTAAEQLSISISTLDRLIKNGELRAVKLDGRVLVSPEAARDFVQAKEAVEDKKVMNAATANPNGQLTDVCNCSGRTGTGKGGPLDEG